MHSILAGILLVVMTGIIGFISIGFYIGNACDDLSDAIYDYKIARKHGWCDTDIKKTNKVLKKTIIKYSILLLVIATVVSTGLGFGITNLNGYYNYSYSRYMYNIVSIERDSSVSGSFFLGSGHIDSKMYYFFYHETDKGYKLDKLEHDETYIIETDSETPHLDEIKEEQSWDSYYVLTVPTNTIVKEFHV